jgi:tol-pal system protein YbgF
VSAATKPAAAPVVATAPVASVATVDPGVETRAYEAAQGERRVGNYQGAIVAFQNFIKQHPKSILAPRAQYWIGDSYFNLRDFRQAITSQQALIKTYPDSPSVPDAMLNMASSQIEMGDAITGKKTLEELAAKFPISDATEKAKRRLAALNALATTPAAASGGQPAAAGPAKR